MKNYILLMTGSGEGCDYTIGCNLRWERFSEENFHEAFKSWAAVLSSSSAVSLVLKIQLASDEKNLHSVTKFASRSVSVPPLISRVSL